MKHEQYIEYQNQLYIVDRIISTSKFKGELNADILKQWSNCDTILQRENQFYFCKLVPDAEIISG